MNVYVQITDKEAKDRKDVLLLEDGKEIVPVIKVEMLDKKEIKKAAEAYLAKNGIVNEKDFCSKIFYAGITLFKDKVIEASK